MVRRRDDIVGLESSIIMHPKVWEASGHVAGFSDPLVDCKASKQRYRADQLFWSRLSVVDGKTGRLTSPRSKARTPPKVNSRPPPLAVQAQEGTSTGATGAGFHSPKDFTEAAEAEIPLIPSPATGEAGSLTAPRAFNMMFQTNVGAMTDASSVAYLRPETAQGMFVDFKNVVDTTRVKLPFGIAQIGKSFRNEITPRNFIFRSREFEQMEMEYFIHEDADWLAKCHEEWITWCENWLRRASACRPRTSRATPTRRRSSRSTPSRTVDIMFKYPFGVQELWGIAARSDYDLQQHQKHSGVPQTWFDEATKQKVVPHVIEPAVGVDRIFLAVLCAGYAEEDVKDEKGNVEKRTVLRLSPRLAPVKVAVLPLLKNKEALTNRARALHQKLQKRYAVQYDDGGAIGKRYRRQDEAGTPWCVTIDFDTIEKPGDTFTLRERDSMQQRRITEAELFALLEAQVY